MFTFLQKPVLTKGATSFDFDQQEEKIYIASRNSIYRVSFDGSGESDGVM